MTNFSGIASNTWVPWTFQELTLQRIPDPVVPFTVAASVVATVGVSWALTPRIGVVRAVLVGVSTPVGAVGAFELAFLFIAYPSAFWIPAHLGLDYWGYALEILSYALFGLVGGGWWRTPRWWWLLLGGVTAGFAIWYLVGVPLTVPSIGGHTTAPNLLLPALVGNVVLKWAVFVLLAAPPVLGARRSGRTGPSNQPRASPDGSEPSSDEGELGRHELSGAENPAT